MLIVHRCECGHLDRWHSSNPLTGTRSCADYRCRCTEPIYGRPEVIPSWRGTLDGTWLDTVTRPPECDCGDCATLFAQAIGKEVA
ncbi:hypothetical protein [Saccharomonospora glauca]|uniref:Uncharacterized protein n=1 Tax=Saccharomonospora glauca K62 TaxID=928724 RepID=I1D4C8_9PSEU|nr:hypothetical protein [Saccharomonospora glauca]EIE99802.1 hypothetical protein SacglDRAFT_02920 [Saccharomonospora glauca K62]